MNSKEEMLANLYNSLADTLNISKSKQTDAINSYEAVGRFLGSIDDKYEIAVAPQGSFSLGTVIKPLSDEDGEYDIDLICLIKNGYLMDSKAIKLLIGNHLKGSTRYAAMLEDKEGRRCWKLQYSEFHMDILPSVPKEKNLINTKEIRITHKIDNGNYERRYSNPYAYQTWFKSQMQDIFQRGAYDYSVKNAVEIDQVETFRVRTPLQKSIQLLKRHKDIIFKEDDENAPISIIITTLAAHAYNGENNLYKALETILNGMEKHIIKDATGKYFICNPVMNEENFADKWEVVPEKAEAFFAWLLKAKKDILENPLQVIGFDKLAENLSPVFGKSMIERAFEGMAKETRESGINKNLYVDTLNGGLTTEKNLSSVNVPPHNFFGV